MTRAVVKPPTHPREQVKCFRNVSENDNHDASTTKYLQERPCSPLYAVQNHRTENQGACWNECGHCFNHGVIHSVVSSPKGFPIWRRTLKGLLSTDLQSRRANVHGHAQSCTRRLVRRTSRVCA